MIALASATSISPTNIKPSLSIEESNAFSSTTTASPLHPKWGLVKERELFGRQADPYQTVCWPA